MVLIPLENAAGSRYKSSGPCIDHSSSRSRTVWLTLSLTLLICSYESIEKEMKLKWKRLCRKYRLSKYRDKQQRQREGISTKVPCPADIKLRFEKAAMLRAWGGTAQLIIVIYQCREGFEVDGSRYVRRHGIGESIRTPG